MFIYLNLLLEIDSNHVTLSAPKCIFLLVNIATKIPAHFESSTGYSISDILGVNNHETDFSIHNPYLS
jgi:hypothetical protein